SLEAFEFRGHAIAPSGKGENDVPAGGVRDGATAITGVDVGGRDLHAHHGGSGTIPGASQKSSSHVCVQRPRSDENGEKNTNPNECGGPKSPHNISSKGRDRRRLL